MEECKRFPINGNNGTIPWGVAEQVYIEYCKQYGNSQTIETMAARGGFAISELDMFHPNWRPHEQALERIKELEEILERGREVLSSDLVRIQTRDIGSDLAISQWMSDVDEALQREEDKQDKQEEDDGC
jgi:hypothetical protein